jgi:hypothetical protein
MTANCSSNRLRSSSHHETNPTRKQGKVFSDSRHDHDPIRHIQRARLERHLDDNPKTPANRKSCCKGSLSGGLFQSSIWRADRKGLPSFHFGYARVPAAPDVFPRPLRAASAFKPVLRRGSHPSLRFPLWRRGMVLDPDTRFGVKKWRRGWELRRKALITHLVTADQPRQPGVFLTGLLTS